MKQIENIEKGVEQDITIFMEELPTSERFENLMRSIMQRIDTALVAKDERIRELEEILKHATKLEEIGDF